MPYMSDKKKVGRPLKYKTEKDLCDELELNIVWFTEKILKAKYLSHKRESYIKPKVYGANKPRIDFDIQTSKGRWMVECKNPNNTHAELISSISQLLNYGLIAEPEEVKLCLVTSRAIPQVQQVILKYELPISVVYINEVIATWDMDFEKKLKAGEVQVEEQYAVS